MAKKRAKGGEDVPVRRPKKVDVQFVAWLLQEHVFRKSVELPVVQAIVRLLVREKVFVRTDNGLELVGHEGVIREVPERTAPQIRKILEELANQNDRIAIVTYFFPHDESFHRFALKSRLPDALRVDQKNFSEILRDLEWHAENFIEGFGAQFEAEGKLVTRSAIDWFSRRVEAIREAQRHPASVQASVEAKAPIKVKPLHPTAQAVLDAVRESPPAQPISTKELAKRVKALGVTVSLDRIGRVVAQLKKQGLVDSARGMGIWHGPLKG